MNARLIILCFCLFPIANSFAQSNLNNFYRDFLKEKRTNDAFFKTIEGSQYENENFAEAQVFLKGNEGSKKYLLRYNNLFDEMEMKNETNDEYLVVNNKDLIDSILLNDEVYLYLDFIQNNKPSKGFFVRLTTGKIKLFYRQTKEYIPERKPTGGYQEYIRPSIETKPVKYYLIIDKGSLELLPEKMSGIIKFLKKKGYDADKIMKDNKLKYKSENIVELIQHLNNL